ncbi:hypothetical protein [Micromonospora sp. CA-244673]
MEPDPTPPRRPLTLFRRV